MKGIIVGGINIIEKNKKLLLIKEKVNVIKGKWNLPGGSLNVDEDIIDCAKREAKEETNLKIKPLYLVGIYNQLLPTFKTIIISLVFKSDILGGEILQTKDVEDIKWFSFKEIEELNKKNLLSFPYVLRSIQDYRAGRKISLKHIATFR